MSDNCSFCGISDEKVVSSSKHTVTIRDEFPVSPGHTLILPKRHVVDLFGTTEAERNDILIAVNVAKHILDKELGPDGYNIGINNGRAAGQTVMHLHIIPRFAGDCDDPRGGIRWIFSNKANYWDALS